MCQTGTSFNGYPFCLTPLFSFLIILFLFFSFVFFPNCFDDTCQSDIKWKLTALNFHSQCLQQSCLFPFFPASLLPFLLYRQFLLSILWKECQISVCFKHTTPWVIYQVNAYLSFTVVSTANRCTLPWNLPEKTNRLHVLVSQWQMHFFFCHNFVREKSCLETWWKQRLWGMNINEESVVFVWPSHSPINIYLTMTKLTKTVLVNFVCFHFN